MCNVWGECVQWHGLFSVSDKVGMCRLNNKNLMSTTIINAMTIVAHQ